MIYFIYIILFIFSIEIFCEQNDLADVDINFLKKALEIPAGGTNGKSYYNISINGKKFGGERSWDLRWNLIKGKLNLKNKKILDIGCNIGICSMYMMKFEQAKSSTGIDRPNNKLIMNDASRLIEAANLLAKAFNKKMDIIQIDLNETNYEAIIGYDYDFVICMSILKWINDKNRFLKFISNFKEILYEGHESDEIEISRFKNIGFKNHIILGSTHIGSSYPLEQERKLIYFSK